jgi:hypothetical protein
MLLNVVFFRAIQKYISDVTIPGYLFNMKSCFLCPVSEAVTQCPHCQELAYCPHHRLYHRGRKKRFTVRYISEYFAGKVTAVPKHNDMKNFH